MVNGSKRRIYISSTCFLYNVLEDPSRIPAFVDGIEFSGNFQYYPIREIENMLDNIATKTPILIHGYFPAPKKSFVLTFSSRDKTTTEKSFEMAESAFMLCKRYNLSYYSFHPGYLLDAYEKPDGHFGFHLKSEISYECAFSTFVGNFEKLHKIAAKYGITLVVENLFENDSILGGKGRRSSLNCTFEEFDALLQKLPDDTGILLDLGHLNMSANYFSFCREGYIDKMISKYGDRIYELHISSNNGIFDQHLAPNSGDWQLDILKIFRDCPGNRGEGLNITLEARKSEDEALESAAKLINNHL